MAGKANNNCVPGEKLYQNSIQFKIDIFITKSRIIFERYLGVPKKKQFQILTSTFPFLC